MLESAKLEHRQTNKATTCILVVQRLLTHGIRKVINQLKEMNADHEF